MEKNMSVGEVLKMLRKRKRCTQDKLSQSLGVQKQTIYKYENGITDIICKRMIQIINALNLTNDETVLLLSAWFMSNSSEDTPKIVFKQKEVKYAFVSKNQN